MTKNRFKRIWQGMKRRCYNPNDISYEYYGLRRIKVCSRWKSFENFKEDMYQSYLLHVEEHGEKQTSLDRIDRNKNYEPSNCRWTTWKEQAQNRRKKKRSQLEVLRDYLLFTLDERIKQKLGDEYHLG